RSKTAPAAAGRPVHIGSGRVIGPELVLGQKTIFMQVKWRPARLRQRPVVRFHPLAAAAIEKNLHARLVYDSGVVALEPVIEPSERFVVILVYGAIEIDRWTDRELFRSLPRLP